MQLAPTKIFALIDCNNFFVSCERIFRPDLEGKPVVVLSSNDGCAVARSNEAKQLGIPMGAPAFQYRQLFKDNAVTTFSANFELYGDISKRITQILTSVTPRTEVYSVDESFLDLSTLHINDYAAWGRELCARILREVGVPVSVGIAPSKTLAKLTAELAKQNAHYRGAVSLIDMNPATRDELLATMPLQKIWGVGRKLAPKLRAEGLSNAYELSRLLPRRAQQLMGIHGRQLVSELQGISCYPLDNGQAAAKSIMRGRTFGEDTSQIHVLEAAVASLAAQATFRLRQAGLLTRYIGLSVNTNRHTPGYQRWSRDIKLDSPTSDSGTIISRLVAELSSLHQASQRYHRLVVYLHDFVPTGSFQTDLLGFIDSDAHDKSLQRMHAVDAINQRFGKGHVYYAAESLSKSWQPQHQIRSPRYVSNWQELPQAYILDQPS